MQGKKTLTTVVLSLITTFLWGQEKAGGKITNNYTGTPLPGVTVVINPSGDTIHTNPKGIFTFPETDSLTHIVVKHPGYHSRTIPVSRESFYHINLIAKEQTLNEVVISGFNHNGPKELSAGSVAKLEEKELESHHSASLLPSLNRVPGVRMDERGIGGSARISIRGSKLRAPWGVRNIKAYWNGIPITSPDGSTPIEVIDMNAIQSAEVIKGPSGSMYGAGNGGVIKFQSKNASIGEKYVQTGGMAGSYGLQRQTASAAYGDKSKRVHLQYSRQRNSGYREQEFNRKDYLRLNTTLYPDEKSTLSFFGFLYDGKWGLPGSLTREGMYKTPREGVQFSIDGDASVAKTTTMLGASHTYQFNDNWKHVISLYGNFEDKLNPYGTNQFYNGIKYENTMGRGLRTKLVFEDKLWGDKKTKISIGHERQSELLTLREFSNDKGNPGTLTENSDTRSATELYFLQGMVELTNKLRLNLGGSYNKVSYKHQDLYLQDSLDFSNNINFDPGFFPRAGLVYNLPGTWALHTSVSRGYSAPTLWEMTQPNGSIDDELGAQTGINYEGGVRGSFLDKTIQLDITGYIFRLQDAILEEERTGGYTDYANIGSTRQEGIEATVQWSIINNKEGFLRSLQLETAYTLQKYKFLKYGPDSASFSGNKLPGIPTHTLNKFLSFETQPGFYGYVNGRWTSRIPLNSENTDYQSDYYLLNSKLGYKTNLADQYIIDIHAGAQNLLDERYSAFLQVNDRGQEYFNPSPDRHYFTGASFQYQF